MAVAGIVRLLRDVDEAGQAFVFALQLGNATVPAPPPHLARQQLLLATLAARMTAGDEEGPLLTVYELAARKGDRTANHAAIGYEHAAHLLVQWRQDKIPTADAPARITARSPPSAPTED